MHNDIRKTIVLLLLLLIPCLINAKEADIYWTSSAGKWFPADPQELKSTVDGYLQKASVVPLNGELVALISPHAGYPFSGPIAAYSYKQLVGKKYDTVILLGLAHQYPLNGAAIISQGAFETPLGKMEIDSTLSAQIMAGSSIIKFNPEAFQGEHSVENQLPFLQRTLTNFKIVPILIDQPVYSESLAKAIIAAVNSTKSKKILIVASTDLSHLQYPKPDDAKKTDYIAIHAMESLDPNGLNGIPCGEAGVKAALLYAKSVGAKQGKLLKYGSSYEVTHDLSWVVGYAAVAIVKSEIRNPKSEINPKSKISNIKSAICNPQSAIMRLMLTATKQTTIISRLEPQLDERAKQELLKLARNTLETYTRHKNTLEFKPMHPVLEENWGAFVTLMKNGQLRGCIGHFGRDMPLHQVVKEMTIAAATEDPRFRPVKVDELPEIKIKISVLSDLKPISDVNEIIVGKHGVYIRKGFRGGTYLPEVATEQGWNRTQMLESLCEDKAGLSKDAWKDKDTQIFTYTSQIFGEK